MLTFSTENTLSLEPKSPPGSLACSTIYFLLASPLLRMNARTKQYLLCKTKPISKGLIITVTSALTSTYEEKPPLRPPKNKANPPKRQNQRKPILLDTPASRSADSPKTNPRAQNNTFYAKQSQFAERSNERNYCYNKGLRKYSPLEAPKNKANCQKRPE